MSARVVFLGDVNIGGDVTRAARRHPPEWFWGDTLPLLEQADAIVGNLECPVTRREEPWDETFKAVLMRADPAAMPVLTAARLTAVALANNHTLDRRREGLLDTLDELARAGIAAAGAGRNAQAAQAPALFQAGGVTVGLISATDNMPWFAAGADKPGLNHLNIYNRADIYRRVEGWVTAAREAGARAVVLSLHWGPNYRLLPPRRFRRFARKAIDLGVTVVHGHSAHVVQPVERHGDGVILYDTGDALDDYWAFLAYSNNWSYFFDVEIDDDASGGRARVGNVRLWPISLKGSPPVRRATAEEAAPMNRRLSRRSKRFGTRFRTADGALCVE